MLKSSRDLLNSKLVNRFLQGDYQILERADINLGAIMIYS